jgi:flagellar biosynthesis/type III secretory pathway protein FliH
MSATGDSISSDNIKHQSSENNQPQNGNNFMQNIDPAHLDLTKLTTAVIGLSNNMSEYLMQTFKDAYLKGLQSGYTVGYENGMKKGHSEGIEYGKAEGLEQGKRQAMLEARKKYADVLSELTSDCQQNETENVYTHHNNVYGNGYNNGYVNNNMGHNGNSNQMANINPLNFYGNRM